MKSCAVIGCIIISFSLAAMAGDSTTGVISTIAGNGIQGYSGDGGPATSAQLDGSGDIAVDTAGNLYIAGSNAIRKVSPDGVITTVPGAPAGDIAVDAAGNIYISRDDGILKMTPAGAVSTVASDIIGNDPGWEYLGALVNDSAGNVYFAYVTLFLGTSIYKVNADATTGIVGHVPEETVGLAVDSAGNLYVSTYQAVWKVTPRGSRTNLFRLTEESSYTYGVAVDGKGNLFIAEIGENTQIWRVTPDGTTTVVAGNGTSGFSGDGGPATSAQLNFPASIAVDDKDNLLIGDSNNFRVRKVTWETAVAQNTSYYLPHVVNGDYGEGSFRTTFVLVNNTDSSVTVTLRLTRGDTTIDGNPIPVRIPGLGTNTAFSMTLAPGATRFLQTDGSGILVSRAAEVTTSAPIGVSAIFSDYDRNGNLIAESGADASSLVQEFVFPVDEAGPIKTGLALYSPQDGTMALTLLDTAGVQQLSRSEYNLAGDERSLLNRVTENLPAEEFRGTVLVQSSAPVAALALRGTQSSHLRASLPVVGRSAGKTSLSLPQAVNGDFGSGRFTTSFQIFNLSSGPANVTVTLTRDDGSPLAVTVPDKGTGNTFNLTLTSGASTFIETDGTGPLAAGAAVISSDVPIGASAILTVLDSAGNFLTETGMGDSPALSQFTFPVEVTGSSDTGIAFYNPSTSAEVTLDLRLLDAEGVVMGTTQLTLPAMSHTARLVSGLFPGTGNFQGSVAVTGTGSVAALALRQNTPAGTPGYATLPVTSGVTTAGGTRIGATPTQVNGLTGVVAVTDGAVLKSDGTVLVLKATYDADMTTAVSLTPTPVDGLSGVAAVSGRMALKSDGTVWDFSSQQPAQVSGISDMVAIHQSSGGVVALMRDGTVWAWWNPGIPGPIEVDKARGAVAVAELPFGGLALMRDGTVWQFGLMGEASDSYLSYWGQIYGLDGIVAIDATYGAALALKNDGTVWQFGDSATARVRGVTGAVGISVGEGHGLALAQDGTVWEWWGEDWFGYTVYSTPRQVAGLTGVVQVAASWSHGLALLADGTVRAWGYY